MQKRCGEEKCFYSHKTTVFPWRYYRHSDWWAMFTRWLFGAFWVLENGRFRSANFHINSAFRDRFNNGLLCWQKSLTLASANMKESLIRPLMQDNMVVWDSSLCPAGLHAFTFFFNRRVRFLSHTFTCFDEICVTLPSDDTDDEGRRALLWAKNLTCLLKRKYKRKIKMLFAPIDQ